MKTKALPLLAAAFVLGATSAGFAQTSTRTTKQTNPQNLPPGQMMHKSTTKTTKGASSFTPGHEMKASTVKGTTGASGFAPGHEPATSTTTTRSTTRSR